MTTSEIGLIGHPLGHSFSKTYFTEKFKKQGLDWVYQNFDIEDISLIRELVSDHPVLKGFNVTIPYKEAIIPFLDELDPVALEVGAVNTVKVLSDGRLIGYNTDVIGLNTIIPRALPWANGTLPLRGALILGTGGASKAVQYVLRHENIPYHLVSRDPKKGDFTYQDLTPAIIQSHLFIINATPVGTAPHVNEKPDIPYEALTPQHTLFDLIYNPEATLFLQQGRKQNAHTINGLAMLHAQAEASWTIFLKN